VVRDAMPTMRSVMTPFPQVVEPTVTAGAARALMTAQRIHHLPVVAAEGFLGVATATVLAGVPASQPVGELALTPAVEVPMSMPLDRVLDELAARRLDVAVAFKDERVAGIFTLVDACRRFAVFLRQVYPGGPHGDSAA
jgi:CBS domain-containing protein